MSEYLRFSPESVRSAIVGAIERAQILGTSILINPDSVKLNRRCEIDFEICANDFTVDEVYDERLNIIQNNMRSILKLLQEYNSKRLHHVNIERKFLRGGSSIKIFSVEQCQMCVNMCSKSENVNDIIEAIEKIEVVSCDDYV